MANHAARTDSSVLQFQARVPLDLVGRLRGTVVSVECPAMRSDPECTISFKLGRTAKASLRTHDEAVATVRRLRILERLETLYAAARTGQGGLSHRQMIGLAGEVYGLLRASFDENPGDPDSWAAWKGFVRAARQGRIPTAPTITPGQLADERADAARLFGPDLTAGIDALPPSGDRAALEDRCGRLTWWVLSRHGLHVDRETRLRLLEHVADACIDAGWAIKRAAQGDYTPDAKATRFPTFEARAGGITLGQIFDRWKAETKPAPSTETTWRGIIKSLSAHVGHDDAGRITDHDIVRWKDSRVAAGRSAKTVNDSDLACLRAMYRFAISNKLLSVKPAAGVKVSAKKQAGTRMLPYEDSEVARLLAISARETHPARRWLPWLAVLTGARIGELAQLWGDQVREIEGIPVIEIRPSQDGGTLKNEGSERVVPLHPALVEAGFRDFARACGARPMFYGRPAKPGAEGRHPSKGTSNHLATWIRDQGFSDPRKAPAHAARHWFKSTLSRIAIPDSISDALQGHADGSSAATYRHLALSTLAEAVRAIPVPVLRSEPSEIEGVVLPDPSPGL